MKKILTEILDKGIQLYQAGLPLTKIKKEHGISIKILRREILRRGILLRDRSKANFLRYALAPPEVMIPNERHQEIADLYTKSGWSVMKIAKAYSVSRGVITRILERQEVKMRTCGETVHFFSPYVCQVLSEDNQKLAIEAYKLGKPLKQIGKRFEVSKQTIRRVLTNHNIYIRDNHDARKASPDKESWNDEFFSIIDTEEKAYWLGFINADGYVKDYAVSIALQATDAEHLRKFCRALNVNPDKVTVSTVRDPSSKTFPKAKLHLSSLRIVSDLKNLGIYSPKSGQEKIPPVPPELLRHYFRGHFDGDGSLFISSNTEWSFDICGSYEICDGFLQFLLQNGVQAKGKVKKVGKIHTFRISGTTVPQQAVRVLYVGATIYLDRKFELAQKLLSEKLKHGKKAGSKSLYYGVGFLSKNNRWDAGISNPSGVYRRLGIFRNEIAAAYAFNVASRKLYGQHAIQNDIDEVEGKKLFDSEKKPKLSKYRGVSRGHRWCAQIIVNSKRKFLGYFDSEDEAALAYNVAAESYLGSKAKLNSIPEKCLKHPIISMYGGQL